MDNFGCTHFNYCTQQQLIESALHMQHAFQISTSMYVHNLNNLFSRSDHIIKVLKELQLPCTVNIHNNSQISNLHQASDCIRSPIIKDQ